MNNDADKEKRHVLAESFMGLVCTRDHQGRDKAMFCMCPVVISILELLDKEPTT